VRSSRHAPRVTVGALRAAASLSLLAAAMHLWAVPDHLEEWWGYGAFFVVLALAQGLYALGLVRWPPSRAYFLVGVAGNLAVAILWLVTRTTGIPLLGPHAGEVEGGRGAGSRLHCRGGRDRGWAWGSGYQGPSDGGAHPGRSGCSGHFAAVLAPTAPAGRILVPLIRKSSS
jgi:hypothetical protein